MSKSWRVGGLLDSWRSAERSDQHTSSRKQGQNLVFTRSRSGAVVEVGERTTSHAFNRDSGQNDERNDQHICTSWVAKESNIQIDESGTQDDGVEAYDSEGQTNDRYGTGDTRKHSDTQDDGVEAYDSEGQTNDRYGTGDTEEDRVEASDDEGQTYDRYRTDDTQEDGVEASDGEEQINKRYRDGKKMVKFTVDNETDSSHPVPKITQDDATELKQRGC